MKIDGSWTISDVQTFGGMVTGQITVESTGSLNFSGMCCSNVVVRGTAVISGMVVGDLLLDGGTVELRGMVKGSVYENGGNFQAAPTSMILGKRVRTSAAS